MTLMFKFEAQLGWFSRAKAHHKCLINGRGFLKSIEASSWAKEEDLDVLPDFFVQLYLMDMDPPPRPGHAHTPPIHATGTYNAAIERKFCYLEAILNGQKL